MLLFSACVEDVGSHWGSYCSDLVIVVIVQVVDGKAETENRTSSDGAEICQGFVVELLCCDCGGLSCIERLINC